MNTAIPAPPQFVAKWRGVRQSERAVAHQHFLDLCALLDQEAPATADPLGVWYAFEKGVTKVGGGQGFADVWKRDHFAWEYKGKKTDLGDAYRQLLQYREPLENPPLLVVCDIERYEIHTNFTGTAKKIHRFKNDDLIELEPRRVLRAVFESPHTLRPGTTVAQVTEQAAQRFAMLAERLETRGIAAPRAAHFLTQLLFCLFAEDVGLLPHDAFTAVVRRGVARPDSFRRNLTDLFLAMRNGGEFNLQDIAYFNGGLLAEIDIIEMEPEELQLLAEATALDWSSIEPAIIGTLFERSLDPAKRGQLGAHYTGRDDILRIIEPVVLTPLRRDWGTVREAAERLREAAEAAPTPTIRRNRQAELKRTLEAFKARLAAVRVLDPACGSGNFLTVTLAVLLDLEKEIGTYAAMAGLSYMLPDVSPRQLYGMEVNTYAHQLAQVGVWIAYLQWMTANGFPHRRDPILEALDTIVEMDAILDLTDPANPNEPEWPEVDFIVSNAPYLGGNRIRQVLGDAYVDALFRLYAGRVPAFADLVCYWFEKARGMIVRGRARRAGLLATNSIRGGANRRVLERIKGSGDIFMAWSDRPWILEGAAVRVSMVGFDNGNESMRMLDGQPVVTINPDLTASTDLTSVRQLRENAGLCFMGPSPKAPFDIAEHLAQQMLAAPHNINGRPNSDVVRPVVSAVDIVQRSRRKWTIDFGLMGHDEAAQYELPFEYIKRVVYPVRSINRRASYAEKWWQYAEARPGMRRALIGKSRFIATPAVGKHRIFVWMPPEVLCNQGTLIVAREDDYFFGVLHSKLHELWSLRMGTWLGVGNDPRYTPTSTFETFPFPWSPGCEPVGDPCIEAIAQAARELVEKRDRWLNPADASEADLKRRTLTNLYNERPAWLELAHRKLDQAVLDAYGWPHELGDDQVLARLLALNLERAEKTPAAVLSSDQQFEGKQADKQSLPRSAD